ncbi:MAG: hypothetical protein WCT77_07230 [Bacteroidota bacterium]
MRILLKILGSLFLLILLQTFELSAQRNYSNPLEPQKPELKREWGFFLGLGGVKQSGTFLTSNCNCEFSDGGGFDLILGGLFEQEVFYGLRAGIGAGFNLKTLNASYRERENVNLTSQTTGKSENVPIWFRHQADASFFYLPVLPYLKWTPAEIIFLKAGLNFSFLLTSSIKHVKELQDETANLSTGEVVSVFIDGDNPKSKVIEDGPFPGTKSFFMAFEPAVGFNFRTGKKSFFSTELQYSMPLTNVTEKGDNFRFSTFRFIAELRFDITPVPE